MVEACSYTPLQADEAREVGKKPGGFVHQEIGETHIRQYEPPKCIVDGRLRYKLAVIL